MKKGTAMSDLADLPAAELATALYEKHSKAELVDAWHRLTGKKGDTARNGKEDYARMLAEHPRRADVLAALEGADHEHGSEILEDVVPVEAKRAAAEMAPVEAAQALLTIVKQMAGAAMDENKVREVVRSELSHVQPARLVVSSAGEVTLTERTHPLFEKVLRLVDGAKLNVLLVGPAGCGKSHMAEQLARALKRRFGTLHCTAGASESQLLGYLLPTGAGGAFAFHPAQFATMYREGNSLFLIDEMDAADPNMLMVINGALANGHLHIPQSIDAPVFDRGPNAAIIAAANTYGTGPDLVYAGRNQLDAATLDRFYVVEMGYDAGLEAEIAGREFTPGKAWQAAKEPTAQELREFGDWIAELRDKVRDLKLRRVVSTRTLQKGIAARCAGIPAAEVKRDLLAGWTRDELSKVGVQ
jgi:energy-coupling factor transporter ATP-binding protein EcfA2